MAIICISCSPSAYSSTRTTTALSGSKAHAQHPTVFSCGSYSSTAHTQSSSRPPVHWQPSIPLPLIGTCCPYATFTPCRAHGRSSMEHAVWRSLCKVDHSTFHFPGSPNWYYAWLLLFVYRRRKLAVKEKRREENSKNEKKAETSS